MTDIRGNARSPKSFIGRNLLLVFWSPGCPHCRRELPRLQQFYQAEGRKLNFEILAFSGISSNDEVDEGKAFIAMSGMRFPVVLVTDRTVNESYKIRVVPAVYIINTKGIVVEIVSGEHTAVAALYRSALQDAGIMSGKPGTGK